MAEFNLTAYAAAAATAITVSSDADGTLDVSAAIDNSSNRDFFIDIEAYLASVDLSSEDNPCFYIWILPRFDGTNYEDGGASAEPLRAPDAIIPFREGTTSMTQRVVVCRIPIPPENFKICYKNNTGVTLASTSTIKYRAYSEESN